MTTLAHEIMMKIHRQNIWDHLDGLANVDADLQGWNGVHPSLSRLSGSTARPCIIDVGVWKGLSTITMANALRDANIDGCVIAVDTFLGSPEHHIEEALRVLMKWDNGRPTLYDVFLRNVVHAGLQDYIVPFPQTAKSAAYILKNADIKADIIHVDAAHEYEDVLSDCNSYWDILLPGGYMIGDDYVSGWTGVIKAVGEFSSAKMLPLSVEYPKWILRK